MESILDFLLELISYWKLISFFGVLLVAESVASKWWASYRAWARRKNHGNLFRLSIVVIAVAILGFLAFEGERRKNVANRAVIVGQPGIVYNVDGPDAITAYFLITNYGQTIAGETRWEVGVNVLDIAAGNGSFAGLGKPQLQEGPTVIPPGKSVVRHPEYQWPLEANDRVEMVAAIKAREKGVFVFGRILYETMNETWVSAFCRVYAGPNTYLYRKQTGVTPPTAYPDQEYVPCSNLELNHVPRKAPKP